jgi:Restriction Endonuclease associating with ARP
MMIDPLFLAGIPEQYVRERLAKAGGKEIESGKFANPDSSAALAVNAFGWFIDRPADLPQLPNLEDLDWPASRVDVEEEMRFPWRGGRHPWLDAIVETERHLIGVESKRFEPFRGSKAGTFSDVYWRASWGSEMYPYEQIRDKLREGSITFRHLDAAQLIKHAFGLMTQGKKREMVPVLYYIYAEPRHAPGWSIKEEAFGRHREEIEKFAHAVQGAAVRFASSTYCDWLYGFQNDSALAAHGEAVTMQFQP